MCARSVMSDSFGTPWTVACQASLSMEFSRQEYWNGLLFPFPGDLPNPGIKPVSPSYVYIDSNLSALELLALWAGWFFAVGGCPGCYRMFSCIPGLQPLDGSSTS